jgi:hypothetical protein
VRSGEDPGGFVTLGGERHQKAQRIGAEKTRKMYRGEKAWGEISQGDKVRRKGRWRNVTRRQVTEESHGEKRLTQFLHLGAFIFRCLKEVHSDSLRLDAVDVIWLRVLDAC